MQSVSCYGTVLFVKNSSMNQLVNQKGIAISPVNMENRREIGIRAGDTVRVWQKIEEKGKTRLQVFEGLVLARKHGSEAGATFTVRRVSGGVGVEKIFPLYSPMIDKIEIVKRSKVRRAKLYHIREKVAREIKRQMRKMQMVDIATDSDIEDKAKKDADVKEQVRKDEEEKVASETQDIKNEENKKGEGEKDNKEDVIDEENTSSDKTVEEESKVE